MKLSKFNQIVKQHPWIRQFVGTQEIQKRGDRSLFAEWIKNNVRRIVFRPFETLSDNPSPKISYFHGGHYVTDENIHYPWLGNCQYYILFHHAKNPSLFSEKFCLPEDDWTNVFSKIKRLKEDSSAKDLVVDAVVKIWWVAQTSTGVITQEIDIWLL